MDAFDKWYSNAYPKPDGAAKVRAWESRRRMCFAAWNAALASIAVQGAVGEQTKPDAWVAPPSSVPPVAVLDEPKATTWQSIFGWPAGLKPSPSDVAARYTALLAQPGANKGVLRIAFLQAKADCGELSE